MIAHPVGGPALCWYADILLFSTTGVIIGAQIGAFWSPCLPDRLLKTVSAVCVLGIGVVYVVTSVARVF